MSGHGILKYFRPIKKDPPEDKKLPDPSGPLSKVIPSSSIASCNAEVTKVLKQAKRSVTKNCYMKLTPAQRYEIGKKGAEKGVVGVTWKPCTAVVTESEYISQPLRPRDNSAIIHFYLNENQTQFVKVLLVKLSDMLNLSNFVRLFHRQSFALYGNKFIPDEIDKDATLSNIHKHTYINKNSYPECKG